MTLISRDFLMSDPSFGSRGVMLATCPYLGWGQSVALLSPGPLLCLWTDDVGLTHAWLLEILGQGRRHPFPSESPHTLPLGLAILFKTDSGHMYPIGRDTGGWTSFSCDMGLAFVTAVRNSRASVCPSTTQPLLGARIAGCGQGWPLSSMGAHRPGDPRASLA